MIRKLIVLFSVVFACASFAEDGLRIAHVDSKIIFDGYKGTRKAMTWSLTVPPAPSSSGKRKTT